MAGGVRLVRARRERRDLLIPCSISMFEVLVHTVSNSIVKFKFVIQDPTTQPVKLARFCALVKTKKTATITSHYAQSARVPTK